MELKSLESGLELLLGARMAKPCESAVVHISSSTNLLVNRGPNKYNIHLGDNRNLLCVRNYPRFTNRWSRYAGSGQPSEFTIRNTAAFTGFIINNSVLIVAGSLVGASGLILTFIMCKAMNRQLVDVLFKSFGGGEKQELTRTKVGSDADEVAMMADGAQKVIIVPGYGMAVSQCQHQVKEFADLCKKSSTPK